MDISWSSPDSWYIIIRIWAHFYFLTLGMYTFLSWAGSQTMVEPLICKASYTLCVMRANYVWKMSKISKLCIVFRGWFASMHAWSYACSVMRAISPRGVNFAHHQKKNLHSHFFGNACSICWLEKNELQIVYIVEFANGSRCALLFANCAHYAHKSRIVLSHLNRNWASAKRKPQVRWLLTEASIWASLQHPNPLERSYDWSTTPGTPIFLTFSKPMLIFTIAQFWGEGWWVLHSLTSLLCLVFAPTIAE